MWAIFKIFSGAVYLLSIILSVPIAFDVGGRDSGLAYSLSIFLFYFFYSFVKAITPPNSRVRWTLTNILGTLQWVVLPGLLIWSLSRFSVDAGSTDWVSRTLGHIRPAAKYTDSWHEWFFGQGGMLEHLTLGGWDSGLSYSSPVFQLLEGFCSLLVIQAAGQITRWLVNRGRSDTWIVSSTCPLSNPIVLANQCVFHFRSSSLFSPAPSPLLPSFSSGASPISHRSATSTRP